MNTLQNGTQINQLLTTIIEKEEEEEPYEEYYTIEIVPLPLPLTPQQQQQSSIVWNICIFLQSAIVMYFVLLGFIGLIIYLCVDAYKL